MAVTDAAVSSTFLSTYAQNAHSLRVLARNFSDSEYVEYWKMRVRARCSISPTGCWLWPGFLIEGYGHTTFRGKTVAVHRRTLELKIGRALTPQECACHRCDVRNCCNPEHLWPGTKLDNNFDSVRKGRHKNLVKTQCPQGHEYTPENILPRLQKSGRPGRGCKACADIRRRSPEYKAKARERQRRARQKLKEAKSCQR